MRAPRRGVFVSLDDGAHWQRCKLNLPTPPIHDLVVKDDDLVVATHGRSFWILDDMTPLREASPPRRHAGVYLYKPAPAFRQRGRGFRIPSRGAGGPQPSRVRPCSTIS